MNKPMVTYRSLQRAQKQMMLTARDEPSLPIKLRVGSYLMKGLNPEKPSLFNHVGMWMHGLKMAEAHVGKFFAPRDGKPKVTPFTYDHAVRMGYGQIVWVYRCANAVAQAASSVPWEERKFDKQSGSVPVNNGKKEEILNNANPFMTLKELIYNYVIHLMLSGNAYLELVSVNRTPKFLYPLRPDWMKPKPSASNKYLDGYDFQTPDMQEPLRLKPMQVIHTKLTDPLNEFIGMSPITSSWGTVQTENAAALWNKALFKNSAVPSGVLTTNEFLDEEKQDQLREAVEEGFNQKNAFMPMILFGGMKWQQLTMNPREMDFYRLRQSNKFDICAAMGVPPAIVGALEDPTYANYDSARAAFWEDTVLFILELIKAQINLVLNYHMGDKSYVTYDASNVPALLAQYERKVKIAKALCAVGFAANDVNKRFNLGFRWLPWGDVAWMQEQMVPIDSANPVHIKLKQDAADLARTVADNTQKNTEAAAATAAEIAANPPPAPAAAPAEDKPKPPKKPKKDAEEE